MKQRWDFFKHSDSSFGLFYPIHYTVMAVESEARAKEVEKELVEHAGFDRDDVASASGTFVINEIESQDDANWFDDLRVSIAEFIGTEAGFLDDDVKHAKHGGAFVFVHTPDDESVDTLREQIKRLHPIFARRYLHAGIERITYPKQAAL